MVKNKLPRLGGHATKLKPWVTPVKLIVYAAIIMAGVSGWTWWHYVYNSPDHIFWGMIDNNLKTRSYSRTVTQTDGSQRMQQVIQVETSPQQVASSRTVIDQTGTHVVTESIGTPTTDYVRYTELQTAQKNSAGGAIDFSNIKGVWSKTSPGSGATNGQLYNESVLGAVPFGNLTYPQRRELVKHIKDSGAYQFSVAQIRHTSFGRSEYTFEVHINAPAYISVLKTYAKTVGLTQLDAVDPAQYQQSQSVSLNLAVDSLSRQLMSVNAPDSGRTEKLSGYNSIAPSQPLPAKTVPVEELQSRLQALL